MLPVFNLAALVGVFSTLCIGNDYQHPSSTSFLSFFLLLLLLILLLHDTSLPLYCLPSLSVVCDEHLIPAVEVFIVQFKVPEEVAAVTLVGMNQHSFPSTHQNLKSPAAFLSSPQFLSLVF